jgi:ribonuclease P protein component
VQETSSKTETQKKPRANAFRFPKSSRLLKHSDFERVYQQGRRYSLPDMAVFYLRGTGNTIRVGFTVPRSVGGAVQRNRIKRRMREAVRLSGDLNSTTAADVVFNPRRSVAEISFDELLRQVVTAFAAVQSGKGAVRANRNGAAGRKAAKN